MSCGHSDEDEIIMEYNHICL